MNTADPSGDSTGTHAVIARHRRLGALASLPAFALAALFLSFLPAISGGETLRYVHDWIPSLGIRLSFYIDGLSLIFAILITGIGGLVTLYSSSYLAGHTHYGRFSLYLFLFMLSMIGLVLADNLITLFVFWELTTITSYLLIGFDHTSPKARRNALQALFITGGGGLALLAGLIMMGSAAGTFELSEIVAAGDTIRIHEHYTPILMLVLIGAFTKSAQVPFHFWLPNAMAAPTPVSAYLHSATMVKAGIYLLARMHPVLSGTDAWIWTLTIFGAVTAVTASILALRQTDLKMALAYTTVMALGTLTMFLSAEATVAIAAAITFLVVHSLYKASLFMIVGIIDHGTGTREATRLRGLSAAMPITAIAAAASALSMAGFPPFLGFIGKELKYEGALAIASEPVLVATAAILANSLMVAVAGIVAVRPFLGQNKPTPKTPHEPPLRMWIGPLILAALGLTFGLAPSLISSSIVQPAVTAVLGQPETVKLALWHGLNVPLLLSVLTFGLGITIYAIHGRLRSLLIATESRMPTSADRLWDQGLDGLKKVAALQTRFLQGGILRHYIFVVYATFAVAVGVTLVVADAIRLPQAWPDLYFREWAVVALIAVAAVMTTFSRSRLAAVCALGVVGVGVALIFVLFAAPDVAITQLLVETLVVVLVAVIMLRVPSLQTKVLRPHRWLDAILAVSVGGVVTLTLLAVVEGPINRSVTAFFETASVPDAFGRNIVNVILVDFRALDTFGEIAVVAVAALAAYALIRRPSDKDAQ
jgi:multicomponent Na+:H+ antiporter subunit A